MKYKFLVSLSDSYQYWVDGKDVGERVRVLLLGSPKGSSSSGSGYESVNNMCAICGFHMG